MNAIELMNKPVISLFDGKIIGTSRGLLFDKKYRRLKKILIGENLSLDVKEVQSCFGEALMIRNSEGVTPCLENGNFSNGVKVYSVTGKYFGNLSTVMLSKAYAVTYAETSLGERVPLERVYSVSSELMLLKLEDEKLPPRITPRSLTAEPEKQPAGGRYVTDYRFLLGRVITKSVKTSSGKTIFCRNTVISNEVVLRAMRQGKLVELMRSSRKNM